MLILFLFSRKDGRGFSALRLFVRKAAFQARARAAPLVSAGAGKHQLNPIFSDKKTNCPILGRDGLDQNASSANRGRDASMAPALR